jgi:hypothetical protein
MEQKYITLNLDHTKNTVSEIFKQPVDYGKRTLLTLMEITKEEGDLAAKTKTESVSKTQLLSKLFEEMKVTSLEEAVLLGIQFAEVTMAAAHNLGGKDLSSITNSEDAIYTLNEKRVAEHLNTDTDEF